ncbi:MAG: hypothetical protein ACR2PR_00160 [Pseudohongiellaceae bacterium]
MQESLKNLKQKAELCRYAHSCLAGHARWWRRTMDIVIASLTLVLSVMVVFFYRGTVSEYNTYLIICIGLLPPFIFFTQNLNRIFGWSQKETSHTLAVHVWGMWIRDVDFFIESASDPMSERDREKSTDIQRQYVECMDKTPPIPNKKFLLYKIALTRRVALAKKIDETRDNPDFSLSKLDEIEQECVSTEKKNTAATKDKAC